MSPEQCRAARAFLDISQDELAAMAEISPGTVRAFEKGQRMPGTKRLSAIRRTLEAAGIEFIGGDRPGIRRAIPKFREEFKA